MIKQCTLCGKEAYVKPKHIDRAVNLCSKQCYRLWNSVEARLRRNCEITETGCWEWLGAYRQGYGAIKWKGTMHIAHRVSYTVFVGAIPAGMFVCHSCDNPSCINPEHLWIGTAQDNTRDCINKGRAPAVIGVPFRKGNIPHNKVLTTPQVVRVLELWESGTTQRRIADTLSVPLYTVKKITSRKAYK